MAGALFDLLADGDRSIEDLVRDSGQATDFLIELVARLAKMDLVAFDRT
jgi:hypothetical protein